MKGISTILATILIVIIVVALVSLTYTFAIGLFGTASTGAEKGVTATTIRMDKAVSIVGDPVCTKGSTYTIVFTIRHLGATYNITSSDITALFGGATGSFSGGFGSDIAPGSTKSLTWTNGSAVTYTSAGTTFTVSAPAADASKTITCS